jgi:hypothetical protein
MELSEQGEKLGNRECLLMPNLLRVVSLPQNAGHVTSGPATDGALAGAAWTRRLEPGRVAAALRESGLEAALVAEAVRADAHGPPLVELAPLRTVHSGPRCDPRRTRLTCYWIIRL